MSKSEKLARRMVEWMWKPNPPMMVLLPFCSALLQAREALAGNMDQPETPESYDAMMERMNAALAAIDALLKAEK